MTATGTQISSGSPGPALSVIVPLPKHLGLAIECVESLVRHQTYPRERFEVIVMTNGSEPALEQRVEALLGPEDRMIRHETTNLPLLYNLGARQARGRLLFLTESHCIIEPDCLEELVNFLATHDYDGAGCRSLSITPANGWARMEERFHEAYLRTFSRPGDWRKTLWRGFAICRDIYLEAGGFEPAFNHFAEWALGAKLHSRGRRLGYAARATVRHPYTTGSMQLFRVIRDFVRGECAYRASYPREYCERYFGYAEEWAQREASRPALARATCRASLWSLRDSLEGGDWMLAQAQAKVLGRFLPVALLGPRLPPLQARWRLWLAVARSWLWRWSDKRLYRAYVDAYNRMVRVSRLEFIAEHLAAPPPVPTATYDLRLGEMDDEWLVGFHRVERWGDEAFRWSGPVGLIRLGLPRGAYEVEIETRGVRQATDQLCLGVFFNRHRVPPATLRWQDDLFTFRLDPSLFVEGPEQHLVLTCNPLQPWKQGVPDRRELGLPIFSIEFTSIAEVTANPEARAASIAHPPGPARGRREAPAHPAVRTR
jgi:glycosyltransferase involved in cell wall biosynthesis